MVSKVPTQFHWFVRYTRKIVHNVTNFTSVVSYYDSFDNVLPELWKNHDFLEHELKNINTWR